MDHEACSPTKATTAMIEGVGRTHLSPECPISLSTVAATWVSADICLIGEISDL